MVKRRIPYARATNYAPELRTSMRTIARYWKMVKDKIQVTTTNIEADGTTQLQHDSVCARGLSVDVWPAAAFAFGFCLACCRLGWLTQTCTCRCHLLVTAKCQHDIAWKCSFSEALSSRPWRTVEDGILPDDRNADWTPSTDVLGASRNSVTKSEVQKVR